MFQSFCVIAAFLIYKSCCSWFIFNADICEDATEHILGLVFRAPDFPYLILFGDEDFEWLSIRLTWCSWLVSHWFAQSALRCIGSYHKCLLNEHCVILVSLILSEYATQGEEKGSWEGSSSCQCKVSRSCCKDRRSEVRVEGFGGLMNASSGHCVVRYDISIFFQ